MKSLREFLEEAYFLVERRRQDDDSYGFDRSKHDDLEIDYDRRRGKYKHDKEIPGYTSILHKPSGIHFEIDHRRPQRERTDRFSKFSNLKGAAAKAHGHKPEHSVRFSVRGNPDLDSMRMAEKMRIARNAEKVYNNYIKHRFPSGHLVSNEPDPNYGEERRNPEQNSRAELYKKKAKFGKLSRMTGKQYSTKVGKSFHPVNDDNPYED